MLYPSLKAYTSAEIRQMSASQLKLVALEMIDDIHAKVEEIYNTWQLFQQKIAAINPSTLTPVSKEELTKLQTEQINLENSLFKMNERWAERLNLLGRIDRVGIYHAWKNEMLEIVQTKAGTYVLNGLAAEYLKRILQDARTVSDFTKKRNLINDLLEKLTQLEERVTEKITSLSISQAEATAAYENNSKKNNTPLFNRKF